MIKNLVIAGIILFVIALPLWFYAHALSLVLGLVGLTLLTVGVMGRKREVDLVNLEGTEAVLLP
jgi:hypothetical protein